MGSGSHPRVFRFGAFELDPHAGELRKHGVRLHVQEQPLRILTALLERPGEIVTREDLVRTIWPDGVFVDFERGLNAAVNRLRHVLGDSASQPRYIETAARKGYRFLLSVDVAEAKLAGAASPQVEEKPGIGRRSRWLWAGGGLSLLLLSAITAAVWLGPKDKSGMLVQLTRGPGLSMDPAVSPDGKLLAFVSDKGTAHLHLWVQQLEGTRSAVELTHDDSDVREPSFSPDGSTIIFRSAKDGGGIYTIPVIGGEMTRVASEGRTPSFSPDGKWIAYWTGVENAMDNSIGLTYVIAAKGGAPHRLGSDLPSATYPVWAPDSTHLLVFASDVLKFIGMMDWWILSLDGSPSQRTNAFANLHGQGFDLGERSMPRVYRWSDGKVIFTGSFGDTVNIWQMALPERGRQSGGTARRLSSGTTLETSPSLTVRGQLIFASISQNSYIGGVGLGADGVSAPELESLTDTGWELGPSISVDGHYLAFTGKAADRLTAARVKDLRSGKERILVEHAFHPQISPDGSLVAYTMQPPHSRKEVIAMDGGSARIVADGAGYVYSWSHDNRRILGIKLPYDGCIYSFDVNSAKEARFLRKPGFELYQARFAPNDTSVILEALQSTPKPVSKLFLVPIRGGDPVPESEWVPIGDGNSWDDKPRWAADGSIIYFISERDGYRCIWAQRVNPKTGYPEGAVFNVHHFHVFRHSPLGVGLWQLEMDVARDKIAIGLADWTGNIWSSELN
jgi:eukaryotic-like serine/threonine-protein kinase